MLGDKSEQQAMLISSLEKEIDLKDEQIKLMKEKFEFHKEKLPGISKQRAKTYNLIISLKEKYRY